MSAEYRSTIERRSVSMNQHDSQNKDHQTEQADQLTDLEPSDEVKGGNSQPQYYEYSYTRPEPQCCTPSKKCSLHD